MQTSPELINIVTNISINAMSICSLVSIQLIKELVKIHHVYDCLHITQSIWSYVHVSVSLYPSLVTL